MHFLQSISGSEIGAKYSLLVIAEAFNWLKVLSESEQTEINAANVSSYNLKNSKKVAKKP